MIGQTKLRRELEFLIPEIEQGNNFNILFIGPSGHGKTTLAYYLLSYFPPNTTVIYVPDESGNINFIERKRFHFIDEVHTLKNKERFYPIMDSGNFVFIFATNEYGEIPEPLWRRCLQFTLEPYTLDELTELVKVYLESYGVTINEDLLQKIAINSRGSPGVAKNMSLRLGYIFRNVGLPETEEQLENIFRDVLDIDNGMTALDRKYIRTLKTLGISGLERISLMSRIPKSVIVRDIEPFLINQEVISVTPRGRKLNETDY